MQEVYSGQANKVTLPVAARASANPITAGTVHFYLVPDSGANAGKWYQGSNSSWQAAEAIAGAAAHKADGHWQLSIASTAWTPGVSYLLYAKEDGDLHIPIDDTVNCKRKADKAISAWLMGNWRLKSGTTNTFEILDTDDGSTVIAEAAPNGSTGIMEVTLK